MRADNSAHIVAAARRRATDARSRAVTALRRLDADGKPVTFSTVASAARVSFLALRPRRPAGADREAAHPAAAGPGITAGSGPAARNARLAAAPPGSSHRPHPHPGIREPPAARRARARTRRTTGSSDLLTSYDTPGKQRTERSRPAFEETVGSLVNNTVNDTKPQVRQPQDRRAKDNQRQVRERAVGPVGEDLLDDGVVAVLGLGLDQLYLELSRQPGR